MATSYSSTSARTGTATSATWRARRSVASHRGNSKKSLRRYTKRCAQAIIQTAEKYKLGKRFLSLFIGHGVGIGANEPPYIGETLPGAPVYEFQPGMVFAVEPLIWVEGVRGGGGVRLEEMVLITDGDAHVLSRAPFEEKLFLT